MSFQFASHFRPRLYLPIALVVLAGCDHQPALVHAAPPIAPHFSLELGADSTSPSKLEFLTLADDSTVVGVDAASRDVWSVTIGAAGLVPHRVSRSAFTGGDRPLALAATRTSLAQLTKQGRLIAIDRSTGATAPPVLTAPDPARLIGLFAATPGTWLALDQRITRLGDRTVDSLFLRRIDHTGASQNVWKGQKGDFSTRAAFIADHATSSASNGAIVVGLSSPARLLALRYDGTTLTDTAIALTGTPRRELGADDRARVVALFGGSGGLAASDIPVVLPPVTKAWAVPGGYLVMAVSGMESFAVDLYCGSSFKRTVLEQDVADAALLPGFLVARTVASADGSSRMEAFTLDALAANCK